MQSTTSNSSAGLITLGWRVTPTLTPRYWLEPGAKPGAQTQEDLVQVPAHALGYHTAIVAQSGSGKSFFLGRLIEELLLASKARCVILDPNADFRRISEVVDESFWTKAKYDHKNARGFLPHEPAKHVFAKPWSQLQTRLLGGPQLLADNVEQFQLSWVSLSIEFLAEDLDPMARMAVYHCHQFVKSIDRLYRFHRYLTRQPSHSKVIERLARQSHFDLIEEAKRMLWQTKLASFQDRRNILEKEFKLPQFPREEPQKEPTFIVPWDGAGRMLRNYTREIERAIAATDYISEDASLYYFGKAQEFKAQGIVGTEIRDGPALRAHGDRIEVIDLPSFPDWKTRLLALNSALSTEWNYARSLWEQAIATKDDTDTRAPTFIVVDEAHNLMPLIPPGLAAETLREQFRTIAAEGRKYGLFLIICTQRPDKIDPLVLSECENRAIMRLGSRSVLDITKTLFGLEDVPSTVLGKCLEFETGRALLIGRWAAKGPELLYTAMRRTVEGGKSLRASYWAVPAVEPMGVTQTRRKAFSKPRFTKSHPRRPTQLTGQRLRARKKK